MTNTPSRTTVSRIAREMDVISDIQVGKGTKLQWSDLWDLTPNGLQAPT